MSDCTWAGRGLVLNDGTSVQAGDLVSDSTCVGAGRGRGLGLSGSASVRQGWGRGQVSDSLCAAWGGEGAGLGLRGGDLG